MKRVITRFWWLGLLVMGGCSLLEPSSKIDTDGDGTPDAEMTADQAVAWGKAQEAKKRAEVEAEKAATVAKVKKAQREAEQTIGSIQNGNEREIFKVKNKLEDTIEGASADLDRLVATKRLEVESVGATVNGALADIDRKAQLVSGILPIAQGAASLIPGGGGLIASAIGILGAGWIGRSTGRKAGEDKGWEDRDSHQKQIDATYDAGHLAALLAAGIRPPNTPEKA
jgi:hypothetical protein